MLKKNQYCTAATARELDRIAIEEFGIPGFTLMQRAAKATFNALISRWPDTEKLIVCCGAGNNGGDGLLIAILAATSGLQATVYSSGPAANKQSDAAKARAWVESAGLQIHALDDLRLQTPGEHTVVVDALLGTGLKGEVKSPFREAIVWINQSGLAVCAVDIPSGLCSDTGQVLGICVKAQLTVTFIVAKLGLVTGAGPLHAGQIVLNHLGLPDAVYACT